MSSARERKITIEDKEYTVNVLSAKNGVKVGTDLLNMIAPIVGAILDDTSNADIRLEESTLWTEVAVHFGRNFASERVAKIVDEILSDMYVDGFKIPYDDEFAGRLGKLAILIEFALKENFADFFTDVFRAKGLEIPSLKNLMAAKASTGTQSSDE